MVKLGHSQLVITSPLGDIFQCEDPIILDELAKKINFHRALILLERRCCNTMWPLINQKSIEEFNCKAFVWREAPPFGIYATQ